MMITLPSSLVIVFSWVQCILGSSDILIVLLKLVVVIIFVIIIIIINRSLCWVILALANLGNKIFVSLFSQVIILSRIMNFVDVLHGFGLKSFVVANFSLFAIFLLKIVQTNGHSCCDVQENMNYALQILIWKLKLKVQHRLK